MVNGESLLVLLENRVLDFVPASVESGRICRQSEACLLRQKPLSTGRQGDVLDK